MVEQLPILGETLVSIERREKKYGNGEVLVFKTADKTWLMQHDQECCEQVFIEDIEGDLNDLVGEPLLQAEVVSGEPEDSRGEELELWTFYKFATIKGYVTIRWYGGSNGYYSVAVNFEEDKWNSI